MDKQTSALAKLVRENPYRFLSFGEIARLFGFGTNTMTVLVNLGAPVAARKINPQHFLAWLEKNYDKVGKIRE